MLLSESLHDKGSSYLRRKGVDVAEASTAREEQLNMLSLKLLVTKGYSL